MTPQRRRRQLVSVEVVRGVEGPCVVINGMRIAGPKPWAGGTVEYIWAIPIERIREAMQRGKTRRNG